MAKMSSTRLVLKYRQAIFLGSLTNSPRPKTRLWGAAYAVLNFMMMYRRYIRSVRLRSKVIVTPKLQSKSTHGWETLMTGRKKKRGSRKAAACKEHERDGRIK